MAKIMNIMPHRAGQNSTTARPFGRARLRLLMGCVAAAGCTPLPLMAEQQQTVEPAAAADQAALPGGRKADRVDAGDLGSRDPIKRNGKAKRRPGGGEGRFDNPALDIAFDDMAPFFGFATLNGREISGSSNFRDISVRQFPTEGMKERSIRGFQSADEVEGGLFSLTATKSIRPLDLKKPRLQVDLRGIYSSYADRTDQPLGKRISASYIDQFDTGIGRIGISLGVMLSNSFLPKDFYKATTAVRPCNSIGVGATGAGAANCTYNPTSANPTYFATGSHTFRQQRSDESQRAYFAALQWQPDEKWDINLDFERSSRIQQRYRSEFSLTEGFLGLKPIQIAPSGAPLVYEGQSALETLSFERTRDEKYTGGGLSVSYRPTERLTVTLDGSYTRTTRVQTDRSASIGTSGRYGYTIDLSQGGVPVIDFATPVDINNYDIYDGGAAARRGRDTRADTIKAFRADVTYDVGSFFDQIQFGVHYSTHKRTGQLLTYLASNIPAANVAAGVANCRRGQITQDYLAAAGSNINSWAVYDPVCLFSAFTGSTDPDKPLSSTTGGGIAINEQTLAGYAMGTFKADVGALPVNGNVGVRVVETRRDTSVYRFTGNPAPINDRSGSIIDVLPSLNLTTEAGKSLALNAAVYRTLLRSSIDGFNMRRVIAGPAGTMVRQRPLRSWNIDLGAKYAVNKDTAVSLDLFYRFLSSSAWPGDLIIPGGPVLSPALRADSERPVYIRGVGVAASHAMRYLPAPFDGLSVQGSYAYSDSNFRFSDPSATDPLNPLYLFTDPAGIPGLSKHVATGAARYDKDGIGLGVTWEYRSGYFRPTGLTSNRVIGATNFINAFISYQIDEHATLRLAAINLGNEHEVLYRPVADAVGQTSYTGATYQLTLRLRY